MSKELEARFHSGHAQLAQLYGEVMQAIAFDAMMGCLDP